MAEKAEEKSFAKADEVRVFPKGKVELITIGGATIGRATLEPGWRWSRSVQPIAKTKSCEAPHFQYHVAGTLKVVMDVGTGCPEPEDKHRPEKQTDNYSHLGQMPMPEVCGMN